MPAVIEIEGGADNGRSFQIEEEVTRVGRSLGCQIVLTEPSFPDTAVAVRYVGNGYVVYNRSPVPIMVAGHPVKPNQSRPWVHGESISGWRGTVLRLVIDGDPAPAPRPSGFANADMVTDKPLEPSLSSSPVAAPPPVKKTRTFEIVVITLTWLAIIGILVFKALAPDATESEDDGGYAELIAALDAEADKNPLAGEVAGKLRDAQMAQRRGHTATARKLYGEVVVRLRTRPVPAKSDRSDPLDKALKFARERGAALGAEE